MLPLQKRVAREIRDALAALMGQPLTDEQWERCKFPAHFGGLSLRACQVESVAAASYWAAFDMHSAILPRLAASIGRPLPAIHPEALKAEEARSSLIRFGVAVESGGMIEVARYARADFEASPWLEDIPLADLVRPAPTEKNEEGDIFAPASVARAAIYKKLLSRILRVIEAVAAARLWAKLDKQQRVTMLSAGGTGTGSTWSAPHANPRELMRNAHWRIATQLRIGQSPEVVGTACALKRAKDGEVCEKDLVANPFHAHSCKHGGARQRPHKAVQQTLARLVQQADGDCDLERYIPELYDEVQRNGRMETRCAIMDAVVAFPGQLQASWLDVSIRCPHAERYGRSESAAGSAATAGENEKFARYGQQVQPLVWETFGRMGVRSRETLRRVVTTAASGGGCNPFAAARWRTQLERAIIQAEADTYLRAMGTKVAPTRTSPSGASGLVMPSSASSALRARDPEASDPPDAALPSSELRARAPEASDPPDAPGPLPSSLSEGPACVSEGAGAMDTSV